MIFYMQNLPVKSLIIFNLLFSRIFATVKVSCEKWETIRMTKVQYENDIIFTAENPMKSKIFCGGLAQSNGMNSFCFHNGICKLFRIYPCFPLQENSNTEDVVTCYSSRSAIEKRSVANVYDYAGCVWPSDLKTKSFSEAIEKCKEDGGQLITYEHFPTEKDFTDFTSKLAYKEDAYVGVMRKGFGSDFKWLTTGTILPSNSFLWLGGEPNNDQYEDSCGNMYRGKLDDHRCVNGARRAYCHFYNP